MGGGERRPRSDRKRIASNVPVLGSTSPNTSGIVEGFASATTDIRGAAPLFRVLAFADGRRLTAT
jgi:hypothetical protein